MFKMVSSPPPFCQSHGEHYALGEDICATTHTLLNFEGDCLVKRQRLKETLC
ncbi:MAG: hypothetical protein Q4B95_03185 [Lonepinella koalarum]|nr:hypothetical protein [Lonepinella koalarum]